MQRLLRTSSWFTAVSSCSILTGQNGVSHQSGDWVWRNRTIQPQIRAMSSALPLKLKLQACWRQSMGSVLQKLGQFHFPSLFFVPNSMLVFLPLAHTVTLQLIQCWGVGKKTVVLSPNLRSTVSITWHSFLLSFCISGAYCWWNTAHYSWPLLTYQIQTSVEMAFFFFPTTSKSNWNSITACHGIWRPQNAPEITQFLPRPTEKHRQAGKAEAKVPGS